MEDRDFEPSHGIPEDGGIKLSLSWVIETTLETTVKEISGDGGCICQAEAGFQYLCNRRKRTHQQELLLLKFIEGSWRITEYIVQGNQTVKNHQSSQRVII